MACQERSGFLFSHECDQPSKDFCSQCKKALCELHGRVADGVTYCPPCAKSQGVSETVTRKGKAVKRRRDDGYYDLYDDPYWYRDRYGSDHYTYYDSTDFGSFQQSESDPADAGLFEADFEAS